MASASSIVSTAEKYVGKVAYVWGGTSLTSGVDCSGFVLAILELLGYTGVPRTSEEQYEWATPVSSPSPGDLVFAQFPTDTTPSPGHVGIYVGNGQVLSAQDPALGVGYASLASWQPYIVGYGQVPGTSGTGSTGATGSGTTLTVPATAGVSGSGGSVDLAAPIQDMGTLLHGAAEALNFMMDWFEPGQGYRIITVIVGVGAGAGAVKLYTSKSASKEKSAAFPAAILLTSVAFLCAYMAFRTWPVSVSNKAERPAVYAVQILTGQKPPAGPPLADNTDDIEVGLGVLATAYVVTKTASAITGLSGAAIVLDNLFTGVKGFLGIGGEAAEEGGA